MARSASSVLFVAETWRPRRGEDGGRGMCAHGVFIGEGGGGKMMQGGRDARGGGRTVSRMFESGATKRWRVVGKLEDRDNHARGVCANMCFVCRGCFVCMGWCERGVIVREAGGERYVQE